MTPVDRRLLLSSFAASPLSQPIDVLGDCSLTDTLAKLGDTAPVSRAMQQLEKAQQEFAEAYNEAEQTALKSQNNSVFDPMSYSTGHRAAMSLKMQQVLSRTLDLKNAIESLERKARPSNTAASFIAHEAALQMQKRLTPWINRLEAISEAA